MGQHYRPVLIDPETDEVYFWACNPKGLDVASTPEEAMFIIKHSVGMGLFDHSALGNDLTNFISWQIYKKPMKVVWLGENADENPYFDTVWVGPKSSSDEIKYEIPEPFDYSNKWIVNHTKKYCTLLDPEPEIDKRKPYLVSFLTATSNNSIYKDSENEFIGTWSGDVLSIEDEKPDGFEEKKYCLKDTEAKKEKYSDEELEIRAEKLGFDLDEFHFYSADLSETEYIMTYAKDAYEEFVLFKFYVEPEKISSRTDQWVAPEDVADEVIALFMGEETKGLAVRIETFKEAIPEHIEFIKELIREWSNVRDDMSESITYAFEDYELFPDTISDETREMFLEDWEKYMREQKIIKATDEVRLEAFLRGPEKDKIEFEGTFQSVFDYILDEEYKKI